MTDSADARPSSLRVRPYTVTGGRTRSAVELGLEAIIVITEAGRDAAPRLQAELRQVAELCREPLSVAEISAHLRLPLQVAKVLAGDLVAEGHATISVGSTQSDGRPDIALLERVLHGLHDL